MSLTLTITDNGNDTGGLAVLAGGDSAAVNTLYAARFDGNETACGSWTSCGTLTGNGLLAFTLDAGHYFFYFISGATEKTVALISPVVYAAITDGSEAVHYQAMLAVQTRLRLLDLEGIASNSIVVKKIPLPRIVDPKYLGVPMPAIVVSPVKEGMDPKAGVNAFDDVTLPVLVSIVENDNQESTLELHLDRHSKWREQIARAFHNQRLPGVNEIYQCAVEPGNPIDGPSWSNNLYASGHLLKFTARVPRGLNA